MKKSVVVAILLAFVALSASAQPKSFGLRLGPGLEISYQHQVRNNRFIELDAGVLGFSEYPGFRIAAAYDFTLLKCELLRGQFNMFLGPGLSLGMYGKSQFTAGVLFQYGVSYDFPRAPLSVAVDTRPCLWINGDGVSMRFKSMTPMASIRWKF